MAITPPTPSHEREYDRVFRALQHRDRRAVLAVLQRRRELPLQELAAALARRSGSAGDDLADDTSAVVADLHHRHLPVLAEANLVRVDDRRTVTISERGMNVRRYLDGALP